MEELGTADVHLAAWWTTSGIGVSGRTRSAVHLRGPHPTRDVAEAGAGA